VEFIDLYNGGSTGIVWILPQHYYQRVGREGFIGRPLGAGPFRFVSQEAGVQMVFEAWEEYWRRTPAVKTIIVKGVRDPASRLAGLQTGELDLAFGMTEKPLTTVMADRNLRWDPNLTAPGGWRSPVMPARQLLPRQAGATGCQPGHQPQVPRAPGDPGPRHLVGQLDRSRVQQCAAHARGPVGAGV
jgi:hypothetical protein